MKPVALFLLGLAVFLLPQAALADPDRCLERGYLHHFDVRFAVDHTEPCEQVALADISWGGRTVHLKAIRLRSAPITDSPMLASRVGEAAAGVGAALSRMGGRLELDQVTLLLTNWVSPREDDPHATLEKGEYIAGAHRTPSGAECPVSYYKNRTRADGDTFVFILSHEIFHCVQYKTWRDMPEQPWLYEGTAEYFGHLAKAGYRDTSEFAIFDNGITATPLDRMSYEAEVFYLWLSHAYGPPRVREFIETTRRIQDAIEPDMWIHFGQDYFDSRVLLPDGRHYPGNPRVSGTLDIHGDETFRLTQSEPFTLSQVIYAFERRKFYDITYTSRPADTRILWRKADGGSWTTPLTSVSTCDGPQRYRVIWGSTRSRDYGQMTVRAQPASASVCSCPVGVWQETQESLKRIFEQSATGAAAPPRLLSGGRLLTINPDHTGSFIYQDVVTRTEDRRDFWIKQVKSGGTHFTWKTVNGMLLTILTRGADNLLTLNNDIHVAFAGTRHETRRAAAQSIGHQFMCDATGLHLTQNSRGPGLTGNPFNVNYNINMDFTRIGGAPPPH